MTREALSSRFRGFETTIFAEMTKLALEHDAVNLSQGFPDFPGPSFLKDAATAAIAADKNQYARPRGELPLVDAVSRSYEKRHGLVYDPLNEVCVFSGATEGILCALLGLVEPGDEVILFEPYYDSYRACTSIAGGTARFVTLHRPDFRWDSSELRAAFSDRTRLVIVNTPHNPTGRVLSRDELGEVAELCCKHDALCLADEVYDRLIFEGEHVCIATLPGMKERTVCLNSTGKTFSLTGWKIGYAAGPADLIGAMATAHQYATFAVATPFQHAMVQALGADHHYFDQYLDEYCERRDFLLGALRAAGMETQAPEGTYFALGDISSLGWDDDVEFCRFLVETVGIAAVPPSVFYAQSDEGRSLVRFAFCKEIATLEEAAKRLQSHSLKRP